MIPRRMRSRWTGTLLLAAALLLAVPSVAQDEAETGAEEELVDEAGFFATYFSLWPDDELAEPIERNLAPIYLLNLLPFGALWAPLALNDDPDRPDMGGDIVLPYLVPYLGGAAVLGCCGGGSAVFGSIGFGVLASALASTGVGVLGIPCALVACYSPTCLSLALGTVLQLWIAPSSSVNAWGRAYRKAEDGMPRDLRPDDKNAAPAPDEVPDLAVPGESAPDGSSDPTAPSSPEPGSSTEPEKTAPGNDGWVPF